MPIQQKWRQRHQGGVSAAGVSGGTFVSKILGKCVKNLKKARPDGWFPTEWNDKEVLIFHRENRTAERGPTHE
jgi:hypothetical protein